MFHRIGGALVVLWVLFLVVNENVVKCGMTEAQRKEVERLRSELNQAFEQHENTELAQQGVIVQPGWTKGSAASLSDAKVEVTKKELDEVRALRAEIDHAVSRGAYVASVADTGAGNEETIRQLDQQMQMKAMGQGLLDNLTGAAAAAATNESELVGAINSDADAQEGASGGPNVVIANANDDQIDVRKLQRLEVNKRRTKELLVLKSIDEDYSFDLGSDVQEWEHIVHGGEEYFIGRRAVDLLIVQKSAAKYKSAQVLDVGESISVLETYSYWNHEQQQEEGVLLVASGNRIRWYRRNNSTDRIDLYWTWVVGYAISGLRYFASESNDYLAVPSNQSARAGHYALSIYQFDLAAKEFWIAQRLQLRHPSAEVSLLDTGRDLILAVAQNHTADIYTFNPRSDGTDHIRFRLLRRIDSQAIDHVSSFQMGGRSYLALGGLQPQILLYQQGDFVPRTILGNNFGRVELFLPVPVRTYRDDLLLFVQHRVDFESHTVTVLETLIWDGEAFTISTPVPCRIGNHTIYGAACMLDLQRDEGLKGAALLRQGDAVSLIVPRHNIESGLFRLHTQLLTKNSELLDLREIFAFLKDWVREQDELVAAAQRYLATPDAQLLEVTPDLSTLEQLTVPELRFDGDIGELYINAYKWTEQDSSTDLGAVMAAIEQLEADMAANEWRRNRRGALLNVTASGGSAALDVDDVRVEELQVDLINGERFYIHDGQLEFAGTLQLYKLDVRGEEAVGSRQMRQLGAANLDMRSLQTAQLAAEYVECEQINGIAWQELRENLVLLTEPQQLAMLRVEGEVVVEQQMSVYLLNGMRFPADFLWTSGSVGPSTVVRAQKVFAANLSANVIDTENGRLNDVSTLDVVTLSEAQHWTGEPTFAQLEVTERLELNGTAHGRDMEELPRNPTLQEANIVTAACHFKRLQVLGTLHLFGDYDGVRLGALLADVAQRPADPAQPVVLTGAKHFARLALPTDVEVGDAAISGIPLAQFVTLHTPQQLNISVFANAQIYFQQLRLDGNRTYDGVHIEQLLRNAIRLDEPVSAPTTQLNFVGGIEAPLLEVREAVNDVSIAEGYQRIDEPLAVYAARFEHLGAAEAHVLHDVLDTSGSGGAEALLNGVNLRALLQRRDWLLPDEAAEDAEAVHVYVDVLQLSANGSLVADAFNGIPAEHLLHFLDNVDDLAEMVLDGAVHVDHIVVDGDVQLRYLNGQRFDEDVQMTAIWLNRPNFLAATVRFEQPLHVHGALTLLGDYNGQPLAELMADMVWRNDNATVVITAPKRFLGEVTVLAEAQLQAINGLPVDRIATKRRPLVFEGSVRVRGNVAAASLTVGGQLNAVNTSELSARLRYDAQLHDFVLLGTHRLNRTVLDDLTVHGDLNGLEPQLQRFFDRLVYKGAVRRLDGNYTFTGRVTIVGGLHVRTLNGLDVVQLLDDVVMAHPQATPVRVRGPVTFGSAASSSRAGDVHVSGTLRTHNIAGCSLASWLNDTLRVDKPQRIGQRVRFGADSLHNNNLHVERLNDIDMSQVITLHTPQNLSGHLHFSALHLEESIAVGGEINGIADLRREYDNTLMLNPAEPQHVRVPLQLRGARVLGDLRTTAPINGDKQLHEVATLTGPLEFESPLYFQELRVLAGHGMYTKDLVAGIDLDEWQRRALWLRKRPRQWISGNWSVQRLTVLNGSGAINELPPRLARNSDANSRRLCQRAHELWQRQQQRPYALRYLERRFTVALHLDLNNGTAAPVRVYPWRDVASGGDFLLVNANCRMHVYKWLGAQRRYERHCEFDAGAWARMLPLATGRLITLSDYNANCSIIGLNAWHLSANGCIHRLRQYELQDVQDIRQFAQTSAQSTYFYAVSNASVYEFYDNANVSTPKRHWPVDAQRNLKFVPHHDALLLTNGVQLYWLRYVDDTVLPARPKRDTPPAPLRLRLPLDRVDGESGTEPSILRTIDGVERRAMTFIDFEQIVMSTLQDLSDRLHTQVSAIQSDTPATTAAHLHHLYDDENLLMDFVAVMAELQRRRIYPSDLFANVRLGQLRVPGDAAQALAAHTVLEAWPAIVELQELHQLLRDDATAAQKLCACITANLGLLIRDVLLLANRHAMAGGNAALLHQLHQIAERVQEFEAYATQLIADLQAHVDQHAELLQTANVTWVPRAWTNAMSSPAYMPADNAKFVLYETHTRPVLSGSGEIMGVTVGSSKRPSHLLAVSENDGTAHSIHLYNITATATAHTDQQYQTLRSLHQLRALATMRLRDDTLLAYVENCCHVHVLNYRGVADGFMPFAQFKHVAPILQLITLSLPADDDHIEGGATCQRFYVAAVQQDAIVFYELLLNGEVINWSASVCN